ncbi:MAG: ATP-binding cassette domain-containing protein [Coriobacteriales bacterium]|jgi:molybdate transport system ATP-binding protein|nr:ATP-binding cassette domain-containing protein [Coriobacteriales bacterium]
MSLELDIKKSFPTFTLEVAFAAGPETLGLLGESGSGKSLSMRCIAGLETPDEGRIVVNGRVFFDSAAKINLSPQERKTAMLFQNYMLFPNLTVAENIAAGLPNGTSKTEARKIVSEQLELFGLKGFGKRYPIRLSGGQQQRVAVARMLAARPGILMLDEPFSALDSHLKSALEQDMLDLFEAFEGTILYVSHDIDEAFRFCERVAVIDHGRLAEIAKTEDIVSHPATLATLKVSGVKNISPARFIDEHTVEATAWGLQLKTTQTVPPDVAFLGLRASYIRKAEGAGDASNAFELEVKRVSDSRFERTFIFKSPNSKKLLQWRTSKLIETQDDPPQRGDRVMIQIPTDKIHLVTH